ncbi:hypothetical protein NEDG_00459 [Nematocida displodere]|uniref:cDENN domain-containing protein n=1 Tax=Nematocida displodere TaxID=1805483 RepID=A0A177EJ30_9MICR|nr:hypothetical protein NEDG_00459 [Nematocida displodere]
MHEFYIVVRPPPREPLPLPITTMRIVEIKDELVYSEVLLDRNGRILLFNFIDRESEQPKKGVILIERKKGAPKREYFLAREERPTGYAVTIGGQIFVLKYRATTRTLTQAVLVDKQIVSTEGASPAHTPRPNTPTAAPQPNTPRPEVEIYPKPRPEVEMWFGLEKCLSGTEISTQMFNTKGEILYLLGIRGNHIDNGIDKEISLVLLSHTLTKESLLQAITKYNTYICTRLKEVVQVEQPKVSSNYLFKETLIGAPVLSSRSFFFDLLYHLLLEHRVILISQDTDILVNYAQALISSIMPYRWKGLLCVPLPNHPEYVKLIETPVPYLVGINTTRVELKKTLSSIPDGTVIGYVDEDRVMVTAKTKEKKSILQRIYKNTENRRSLPFYQLIVKKMTFTWPTLKTEVNVLMEVISTEVCTAREKIIRRLVRENRSCRVKEFINYFPDYSKAMLFHLERSREFYTVFLDTSLYCTGIANEYTREVKDEGMSSKEMVIGLWLCIYSSGEVLRGNSLNEVKFVIEAFIKSFFRVSFTATESLSIALLYIFSSLNAYDILLYLCEVLGREGVQLTQEMCSSIVPALPEDVLERLKTAEPLLAPFSPNKEAGEPAPELTPQEEIEEAKFLWNTIVFVGCALPHTLGQYVSVSRNTLVQSNPELATALFNAFKRYELPY